MQYKDYTMKCRYNVSIINENVDALLALCIEMPMQCQHDTSILCTDILMDLKNIKFKTIWLKRPVFVFAKIYL